MFIVNDKKRFAQFTELIHKTFHREKTSEIDGYIYIDMLRTVFLGNWFSKLLYAKGVQDSGLNYKIIILSPNNVKEEKQLKQLADAFDAELVKTRRLSDFLYAFFQTVYWFLFFRGKDKIFNIKMYGEKLGIYLSDAIIRGNTTIYNVDRLKLNITYLKSTLSFSWHNRTMFKMFRKRKPNILLIQEFNYWMGPVAHLANKMNCSVITCYTRSRITAFLGERFGQKMTLCALSNLMIKDYLNKHSDADYLTWIDNYLSQRKLGLTDMDAKKAYANKKLLDKKGWCQSVGADPRKKCIVIMAHCFSDCANTSTDKSVYRNYYEWLINTLEIIKDIDNVNWLLKAHPSRNFYGEGDGIYDIFRKYCEKGNAFIVNDDVSLNSLIDFIDGAVTVVGTCGLEFSMAGIPVICTGDAPYSEFGFTLQPQTVDEYKELLYHMDTLPRLTEEKINMAKKVSFANFNVMKPDGSDEDQQVMYDSFKDLDDPHSGEINSGVVEYFVNKMQNGYSLKESWFYKEGLRYSQDKEKYAALSASKAGKSMSSSGVSNNLPNNLPNVSDAQKSDIYDTIER